MLAPSPLRLKLYKILCTIRKLAYTQKPMLLHITFMDLFPSIASASTAFSRRLLHDSLGLDVLRRNLFSHQPFPRAQIRQVVLESSCRAEAKKAVYKLRSSSISMMMPQPALGLLRKTESPTFKGPVDSSFLLSTFWPFTRANWIRPNFLPKHRVLR